MDISQHGYELDGQAARRQELEQEEQAGGLGIRKRQRTQQSLMEKTKALGVKKAFSSYCIPSGQQEASRMTLHWFRRASQRFS